MSGQKMVINFSDGFDVLHLEGRKLACQRSDDRMLHQETARFLSRLFAAVFDVAPCEGVRSFAGFGIVFAVDSLKKEKEIECFLRSRVLGVHAVFPVKEMDDSVVPCDVAESRTAMDDAVLVEGSERCTRLFQDEFLLCFGLVRVEPVLYGRTPSFVTM